MKRRDILLGAAGAAWSVWPAWSQSRSFLKPGMTEVAPQI